MYSKSCDSNHNINLASFKIHTRTALVRQCKTKDRAGDPSVSVTLSLWRWGGGGGGGGERTEVWTTELSIPGYTYTATLEDGYKKVNCLLHAQQKWGLLLTSQAPKQMFPQLHVKDPSHSAKSAGGRLQLNMHAPYVCGFAWSDMTWCLVVWCTQNTLRRQASHMALAM